jgi:hypothetical protein
MGDELSGSSAGELLVLVGIARSVGKFMDGVGDHNPMPFGAVKRGSFWSNTPIAQERLTNAITNPQITALCDPKGLLWLSVDCVRRVKTFPGFD